MELTGKSSPSGIRKSTRKSAASDSVRPTEKTIDASASVKTAVSSAIPIIPNGGDELPYATSERPNGKSIATSAAGEDDPSAALEKPNGKSIATSAAEVSPKEKSDVSAASPIKPTSAAAPPAARDPVVLFRDVSLGPHQADLLFRLVHFWEARNPNTKTLIGQEMLLIDEEGTVIQGFVPSGRVGTFDLIPGSICKLRNFFGSKSKEQFSVAHHGVTVSFSWNSSLTVLDIPPVPIPEDRFRFHSYNDFKAMCDSRGDLYDFVGHMKLVNGQTITDYTVLDEVDIAEKRHLCVHAQSYDGPVMKLYLWDKEAMDFCQKFKSYGTSPRVLLVTTMNPKHLGGTLALTTMSSSRVFMDGDVQPTKEYLEWLRSNSEIANRITAEVVTKPEPVTLEELFFYMRQEDSKVAWFECTATIDAVLQGSPWYYISCGGCKSKAVNGPTSLICTNKKCGRSEVTGVAQYLTKISVYDKKEQATFVILGDAGKELIGRHASELVATYFEANEGVGADHCVPVPQALLDTIGQTHKFIVKVSDHNLAGKTQSLTVTKILKPEAPFAAPCDETPKTVGGGCGSSNVSGGSAGDRARKAAELLECDEVKRTKSG